MLAQLATLNLLGSGSRGWKTGCLCCPPVHVRASKLQAPLSPLPEQTVVRIAGNTLQPRPLHDSFPDDHPLELYRAATGMSLPNEATYAADFREAMRSQLQGKAPAQYDEFMSTGMVNGRQHGWVFLSIPPGVTYPCHAHPGLEMVYIVSGRLHEIRLQQQLQFKAVVGQPGPDVSNGTWQHGSFSCGNWVINEVGSIHQSFTDDEPCVLLALWPKGYVFFPPENLPPSGVLRPVNHNVDNEVNLCFEDD